MSFLLKNRTFSAIILLILSIGLFGILFAYEPQLGTSWFGAFGNSVANLLLEKTFGVSAFYFVYLGISCSIIGLREGSYLKFFNKTLRYLHLFWCSYLLNVLLLNTPLINTVYAGLYPLIFHSIVLNALGGDPWKPFFFEFIFFIVSITPLFVPIVKNIITLRKQRSEKIEQDSNLVDASPSQTPSGEESTMKSWIKILLKKNENIVEVNQLDYIEKKFNNLNELEEKLFFRITKKNATHLLTRETNNKLFAKVRISSVGKIAGWDEPTQFRLSDEKKESSLFSKEKFPNNILDNEDLQSSIDPTLSTIRSDAELSCSTKENTLDIKITRLSEAALAESLLKESAPFISDDNEEIESRANLIVKSATNQLNPHPTPATLINYPLGLQEVETEQIDIDLSSFSLSKSSNDVAPISFSPLAPDAEVDVAAVRLRHQGPKVLNGNGRKIKKSVLADSELLNIVNRPGTQTESDIFIRDTANKLEQTIRDFGVEAKVVEVATGPVITRYELTIEAGIKISRIVNLSDNIAMSLAAPSVRIVAPIPGKSVIGIEIPNQRREEVLLREVVESKVFKKHPGALPIALGKSILGEPLITDLAATPHLLVAGATGSGKSVCVNSIICSLLFKLTPEEIRFIMIDPKMVELTVYNEIPHLLAPVITNAKQAAQALRWVIQEMEARYSLLEYYSVRSIKSYNGMVKLKTERGEKMENNMGTLPYIVVIIDEFADLMMVARKEVEDSVIRLAAMSRAVGIHLLLATQRPSVDVITGIIKANFPSRIAFQVSSKIDSRTILDGNGADKLLGKGDMLFQNAASGFPERIQGAFLSDDEVNRLVEDLKNREQPNYITDFFEEELSSAEDGDSQGGRDELFQEAVQIILQEKKASASYLQRKLKIGYNRAARIIEEMELMNLVGAADGARPREVLVTNWQG